MRSEIHHALCRLVAATTIAILVAPPCGTAEAQLPESYLRLWDDPSLAQRIERNIETHRKGDAAITVVGADGQAVQGASVEVRQQTHEFLFGLPTREVRVG